MNDISYERTPIYYQSYQPNKLIAFFGVGMYSILSESSSSSLGSSIADQLIAGKSRYEFESDDTKVIVKILNYIIPDSSESFPRDDYANTKASSIMNFIRSKFRRQTNCPSSYEVSEFVYYDMRQVHQHVEIIKRSKPTLSYIICEIRPEVPILQDSRMPRYWYSTHM